MSTGSMPPIIERVLSADRIRRMYCVDTSTNPRIPLLMEMVGSVSRAATPQEIYQRFRSGIGKLLGINAYVGISTRGLNAGEYKITRIEVPDRPETRINDPWRQWHTLPTMKGGFFGELIRSAWPELIHHLDIKDDPAVGDLLAPYGSLIAVPIFDNGEPLNWSVTLHRDPDFFTVKDLEDAILRANLVGGMTKNAVMAQQLREANTRIRREVEQIAGIQRALLPDPLPTIHGLSLAASYRTSEQAGGDYYDFFALDRLPDGSPDPSGRWGILIADASGHGPSAAVVMAMLHAIVHTFAGHTHSPAAVLEHANHHLCQKRIENSFVTAIYGVYNAKTREFTYARAGHNPPLVKKGDSMRRLDRVGGYPLGIDPEQKLDEHTDRFEPGETIILYTDGVTEAMDARHQMFGIAGIERAVAHCSGAARCTVESINNALDAHVGAAALSDDQTIVAMRLEE